MFGMPMHPLLVHFPIVLAVLLPIAAIIGIVLIRRGVRVRAAWTLPVVLAAALWGSAFAATQTGEAEEDRVERVVGEAPLHSHEEAAERFLLFSAVVTVVTLAGYAPRTIGSAARMVSVAGAVLVVAAGAQVGHSGGQLVYTHGAASAYAADGAVVQRTADRDED